jgi:hypothetical protein
MPAKRKNYPRNYINPLIFVMGKNVPYKGENEYFMHCIIILGLHSSGTEVYETESLGNLIRLPCYSVTRQKNSILIKATKIAQLVLL